MAAKGGVLLSLGSNSGDRRQNLSTGIERLRQDGFRIENTSPVVESPAMLPKNAVAEWNRPYLNVNVMGRADASIEAFYGRCKAIQDETESRSESKWAPRSLDIDIVAWGDAAAELNGKAIPDPAVYMRPFVLSPLVHMAPGFRFAGAAGQTALQLSTLETFRHQIPMWVGIVNVTPDSFSDGGVNNSLDSVRSAVEGMIAAGASVIDVGAESTRPNAEEIGHETEWERLREPLDLIRQIIGRPLIAPLLSVDTRHPRTAEKALRSGADVINDVSGLSSDGMLGLARESGKQFIAMHSCTVPVDPAVSIDPSADACEVFEDWVAKRRVQWDKAGIDLDRVIIDPGIGFGKTSFQSFRLMRSVGRLRKLGHRVLIGHSRKRHIRSFSKRDSSQLDTESIGASLNMCAQNVDMLRVHDIENHARAYLSWAHLLRNEDE